MAKNQKRAASVSVDELADATVGAVLRAVDARGSKWKWPVGPIIFGFIWYPGSDGPVLPGNLGQVNAIPKERQR